MRNIINEVMGLFKQCDNREIFSYMQKRDVEKAYAEDRLITLTYTDENGKKILIGAAIFHILNQKSPKYDFFKDDFVIDQILIDVSFQRRGFGTRLFGEVVKKAKNIKRFGRECPRIVLTVKKDNKAAIKFYRRLNFKFGRTVSWITKGGKKMELVECFYNIGGRKRNVLL